MRLPEKPRVLIEEPDRDVRELIATYLTRVGCAPVYGTPTDPRNLVGVDLIVAEPASPSSQRLFELHAHSRSSVPIVCVSILPYERVKTDLRMAAYVAKPFAERDLHVAVGRALGARV